VVSRTRSPDRCNAIGPGVAQPSLQAASGLATPAWHSINWAWGYRRVRSLQRRIVQAVQAGAWRKGKRLRSLVVHSVAARALAVKRVPANTGKQTPGVAGELWNTPAQKAAAVARSGRWRGDRPAPLKRIDIPTKNGTQRPLSIPTLGDRAQRHVKVKGDANPCDPAWEASVQDRDRQRAQQASSGVRATVLRQHDGRCLVCRQVIQCEEALERHHRDGDHQHTRLVN